MANGAESLLPTLDGLVSSVPTVVATASIEVPESEIPVELRKFATVVESASERLTIEDRDKLTNLRKCAESKIILKIGGKYFHTSMNTLKGVRDSLFSKIFHEDSPYFRVFKDRPTFFIDRDFKHFDVILNFLRNGGCLPLEVLPRDLRLLNEMRVEAEFYELAGLVTTIDARLARLFDVARF
ncbi:hypothetical protein FSP39_004075 [Pinctada imbricata]|uniref:BTB domain-containing protein n=1 Tax=Pinctada imbricata TaxID=66713 RepID=A0AA88XYR3_PINIB|nr:hypothetical protein FSP39_004075 [Pinctada imbricata]